MDLAGIQRSVSEDLFAFKIRGVILPSAHEFDGSLQCDSSFRNLEVQRKEQDMLKKMQ